MSSIVNTRNMVPMDCSKFIVPVTMFWSELSTFTSVWLLEPMSTLASRTAAGVGRMEMVMLFLSRLLSCV